MDTNQIQQIVDDAVARVVALVRQSITEQVHASLSNGVSKPKTKRGRPAKVAASAPEKKPRKPLSEEAKQRLRDNLAKARKAKARKAREASKADAKTTPRKKRQPAKAKQ